MKDDNNVNELLEDFDESKAIAIKKQLEFLEELDKLSIRQIDKLSILMKYIIRDGIPSEFDCIKCSIFCYERIIGLKDLKNQILYYDEELDELCLIPLFMKIDGQEMYDTFREAKDSQPKKNGWRVSSDYSAQDYEEFDNYRAIDNSVFSIHDGDIISVCAKYQGAVHGRELLKFAVENGGRKLDCYERLFSYYTQLGFCPVSWCKWDDRYAPIEWKQLNNLPLDEKDTSWFTLSDRQLPNQPRENIFFFIYVGEPVDITIDEFTSKVDYSEDYEKAQIKRDSLLKSLLEKGN